MFAALKLIGQFARKAFGIKGDFSDYFEENEGPLFDYEASMQRILLAGWRVHITHKRFFPFLKKIGEQPYLTRRSFEILSQERYNEGIVALTDYKFEVSTKGGKTVITLTNPEGQEFVGVAHCSQEDVFSRKIGRELALERCLEDNALLF